MNRRYDNHIAMAGLHTARVAGQYPSFAKVAPAEGVVIAVRYVDEDRNRSKQYVEYDVRDLRSGQIYTNCRRLSTVSGQDDGEENILRAAQKLPETQGTFVFDPTVAPLTQSDGDRVILNFVNGAHHSPVIVGVIQHRRMAYGAKRADGRRRFMTHQGTSFEIKQDGTYVITRNIDATTKTTLTLEPNGDFKAELPNGARLHLVKDQVMLDGKLDDGIRFGFAATERAVLGDLFRTLYNAFVIAYNAFVTLYTSHVHIDSNGLPTSAPSGVPVPNPAFNPLLPPGPSNPAFLPSPASAPASADAMPEDYLSNKVRVESNP